jgi:hypothetical protein
VRDRPAFLMPAELESLRGYGNHADCTPANEAEADHHRFWNPVQERSEGNRKPLPGCWLSDGDTRPPLSRMRAPRQHTAPECHHVSRAPFDKCDEISSRRAREQCRTGYESPNTGSKPFRHHYLAPLST